MPYERSLIRRSRKRISYLSRVKASLLLIDRLQPAFRTVHKLTGENNSTQYTAVVGYQSLVTHEEETIKIQVGLREPLFMPSLKASARTLLLDPVTDQPMEKPLTVQCLARQEAFAEKYRAALSRRDAAIWDFYDIAYAVRNAGVRPDAEEFIALVKRKLAVLGNEPVNVLADRINAVRRQVVTQLKPVLRSKDFAEFDLEWALRLAAEMAERVSE